MLTFENKETFDLIKKGTYEVELSAEIKETKDGTRHYISCSFRIRDDVEQDFKGRYIYDNIWEDKNSPGEYDRKKIQKLLLVQDHEKGKFNFEDYDELVQYINGFLLRITIDEKEPDEWHDEKFNEVKYLSYAKSNAQPKTLETVKTENAESIDINDDDLPF